MPVNAHPHRRTRTALVVDDLLVLGGVFAKTDRARILEAEDRLEDVGDIGGVRPRPRAIPYFPHHIQTHSRVKGHTANQLLLFTGEFLGRRVRTTPVLRQNRPVNGTANRHGVLSRQIAVRLVTVLAVLADNTTHRIRRAEELRQRRTGRRNAPANRIVWRIVVVEMLSIVVTLIPMRQGTPLLKALDSTGLNRDFQHTNPCSLLQ